MPVTSWTTRGQSHPHAAQPRRWPSSMAESSPTLPTSMMSASCSLDASSARRRPSGPNLPRTMPSTGTVLAARPKVASPIGKARSGTSATGQTRQVEGGSATMGYGYRKFIVHDDGTLDRMRNNVFDRLLRDPQHHSMPAMARRRVRVADIVVQLENRRPICVVRRVYFVVSFDEEGRLDTKRFLQQQWALAESALDPVLAGPNHGDRILDAASRFIAQGGRWRPQADLAQRIDDAALGRR